MKLTRTGTQVPSSVKRTPAAQVAEMGQSEAAEKTAVASSRLGGQSHKITTAFAPTGANAAFQISLAFQGQSPAIAAALVGAQEVFRQRAQVLPNINPLAIQALCDRLSEPAMAVDSQIQVAFSEFVDGQYNQRIIDHAPQLLAWQSYLARVGDETGSRVLHVNMRDMPGVSNLPGLEFYSLRALGLAHSNADLVVVPDAAPDWVVSRLQDLREQAGLPVGQTIKESEWDAQRTDLSEKREVQEFYRSERSADKANYDLQEKFENKNFCMEFLAKNEVTCPELFYQGEASALDISKYEGQAIVAKRVRSAGGLGVKLCKSPGDLKLFIEESDPKEEIQLQELVQGHDCSKQYFISEHGAAAITNTDQIIKNGVNHAGNEILSQTMTKEDNANSDKAAQLIWEQGYRGYMAVDMMKPSDGGKARVIELNLRKGGVTVPTAIASQLGAKRFVSKQVLFKDQTSMEKAFADFAITGERRTGIIPFSICPYEDGSLKVEAVFISQDGGHDVVENLDKTLAAA